MSNKEMRKEATKRLKECQKTLKGMVSSCETLEKQFRRFSDDCLKRMKELVKRSSGEESSCEIVKYFLSEWFRSFLAHKDEAMALWKGTVSRDYLVALHKDHAPQDRGRENSYYKNCKCLTMCSVDGIDYEYRSITEKYGGSSTLDGLMDTNDDCSSRVTSIIDKLDANAESLRKTMSEIKAAKSEIRVTSKENKHMGEEMLIRIASTELVFTRAKTRWATEKRADALSTVVDDPTEADVGGINSAVNAGATNAKANPRNAMVVIDKEDIRASKQAQRESEQQRLRQEERKRQEDADTALSISLDEIKRAFGAQQLQSTFVQLDAEQWGMGRSPSLAAANEFLGVVDSPAGDDDDSHDSGYGGDHNKQNRNKRARLKGQPADAPVSGEAGARGDHHRLGNVSVNVNMPLEAPFPWLPRAKSRMLLARVLVPTAHQARVGGQWLDLPISVTWRQDFRRVDATKAQDQTGTGGLLAVSEVLLEVYRRVWSRRVQGRVMPLPLLPVTVRVPTLTSASTAAAAKGLCAGEYFTLPAPPSSSSSAAVPTVFVLCQDHPSFSKVATRVAEIAAVGVSAGSGSGGEAIPGGKEQVAMVGQACVPSVEVLRRLDRWLSPAPADTGTEGQGGVLDLRHLGSSLHGHCTLLLSALERVSSSSTLSALHLPIAMARLDHSEAPPSLLAAILLLSRRVEASGGVVSADAAHKCAATLRRACGREGRPGAESGTGADSEAEAVHRMWQQYCTSSLEPSSGERVGSDTREDGGRRAPSLCSLRLRHNTHLFPSSSSSGGAVSFLTLLLSRGPTSAFPLLQELDISHLVDRRASRARKQAQQLVTALDGALDAKAQVESANRESTWGPPLRLCMHGLLAAVEGKVTPASVSSSSNGGVSEGERGEVLDIVQVVRALPARWVQQGVAVTVAGAHAVI